ncbi:MAG TPA: ABC transporter permease, partial [Flavisolibacter sp.]
MLKNYIKTAIRNLYRNKTYSFINIFGLALGLATGFIMLLFVNNEYNMNLYHKNADRIYELMARIEFGQEDAVWEQVQAPVANVARESIT